MENLVENREKHKILRLLDEADTVSYEERATVQDERYRRTRQAAWDKRNLRTVSTHLKVEEAEKLQQICNRRGISQYHLIRRLLLKVIAANRG